MREWINATIPIRAGMMHWPDNPGVLFHPVLRLSAGDGASVHRVELGSHTGTHIDAPNHFIQGAPGAETFPLHLAYGRARVLEVDGDRVDATALRSHHILPGERIVLRTRNSSAPWHERPFRPDFVGLTPDAAAHLAERRVALVGIDHLSIASPLNPIDAHPEPVHVRLLASGAWIVEGLRLDRVPAGPCTLLCAPLPLVGLDGAPARVLVRPE